LAFAARSFVIAVARVAGVLAIAVFGIVMVKLFSSNLDQNLAAGLLPRNIVDYVHANEIRLAAIGAPPGTESRRAEILQTSISKAFVFGFRNIMLICAGLAISSSAVAALMIPAKNK
jgi:hypothetical protein